MLERLPCARRPRSGNTILYHPAMRRLVPRRTIIFDSSMAAAPVRRAIPFCPHQS